jgi:hypothetical protein
VNARTLARITGAFVAPMPGGGRLVAKQKSRESGKA